jgi:hypothetical protein
MNYCEYRFESETHNAYGSQIVKKAQSFCSQSNQTHIFIFQNP